MGFLNRLLGLVSGAGPRASDRETFRCLSCGGAHTKQYQTCPDCGGSFVVPDTADEDASVDEAPWK
jgi:hypothetical protein